MRQRLSACVVTVVTVAVALAGTVSVRSQEPRQNPSIARGGRETARGIEKKDIRIVLLYNEGEVPPAEIGRMTRALQDPGARERIASLAKMTKADAARKNPGAAEDS